MANWTYLKKAVANIIKPNGNQEITGQSLQNVLSNIIDIVGEHATFAGVANPGTVPDNPDGPIFYLASEGGVYPNFKGLTLPKGLSVIASTDGDPYQKWQTSTLINIAELDERIGALDNRITDVATDSDEGISRNHDAIEAEVLLRKQQVDTLTASVAAEQKARASEDAKLDEQITDLATDSDEGISRNHDAIEAEQKARASEDSKLRAEIDNCCKINSDDPSKRPLHELFLAVLGCSYDKASRSYKFPMLSRGLSISNMINVVLYGKDWLLHLERGSLSTNPRTLVAVPITSYILHNKPIILSDMAYRFYESSYLAVYGCLPQVGSQYEFVFISDDATQFVDDSGIEVVYGFELGKKCKQKNVISRCPNLKEVYIKGFSYSQDIAASPKLSEKSIAFIINNEAAEKPITFTLHPEAYDRAMADSAVTEALENHPNVSLVKSA